MGSYSAHFTNRVTNGMFTLSNTENETNTRNDNDNYGFHCNMQNTSHCTETLSLMLLATFSLGIGLGVAQCEHTIKACSLQNRTNGAHIQKSYRNKRLNN